jgi:hypothetical protein
MRTLYGKPRSRINYKLVTLAARTANGSMVTLIVVTDGVCFWRESGVSSQAFFSCWYFWQGSGFSRCEDVFTCNLVYKDIL